MSKRVGISLLRWKLSIIGTLKYIERLFPGAETAFPSVAAFL